VYRSPMRTLFTSFFALLANATHRELARQVRYLKAENRILRDRLPERIKVTPAERRRLVRFGKPLGRYRRPSWATPITRQFPFRPQPVHCLGHACRSTSDKKTPNSAFLSRAAAPIDRRFRPFAGFVYGKDTRNNCGNERPIRNLHSSIPASQCARLLPLKRAQA
jgi:hypothetical protein